MLRLYRIVAARPFLSLYYGLHQPNLFLLPLLLSLPLILLSITLTIAMTVMTATMTITITITPSS